MNSLRRMKDHRSSSNIEPKDAKRSSLQKGKISLPQVPRTINLPLHHQQYDNRINQLPTLAPQLTITSPWNFISIWRYRLSHTQSSSHVEWVVPRINSHKLCYGKAIPHSLPIPGKSYCLGQGSQNVWAREVINSLTVKFLL